jgi:hypothetical protein
MPPEETSGPEDAAMPSISSSNLLTKELLALPKGTRITPKEVCKNIENYVHRADKTSVLRKRLTVLSKKGEFRMVDLDTWERA